MKKIKGVVFVLLLSSSFGFASQMEKLDVRGKREEILTSLAAVKPPKPLAEKLERYFKKNSDVFKTLIRQEGDEKEPFSRKTLREKWGRMVAFILKKKFKNLSNNNVVFEFSEDSSWLIKVAGPINQAMLQVANQNLPYGNFEEVEIKKIVPTYQTASRIFYNEKIKEAKEQYGLNGIGVSEKYLWSPKNSCKGNECVKDGNCLIVSRKLNNHLLLKDLPNERLDQVLTKEKIGQLVLAIKHSGLWNVTGSNLAVNQDSGNVVILDTEQPNTMKYSQMFNLDEGSEDSRYGHSINCGVQTLYKTMPEGSKQREWIELCVRKYPEITKAYNNGDLLKLFKENKELNK